MQAPDLSLYPLFFLIYIIKIETIALVDGAGAVVAAIVVDDEGAGAVESTHSALRWERGRITTLVYWFMYDERYLKM